MTIGLILFGHGARDAAWAEPMNRLQERLLRLLPTVPNRLAFLEVMKPDLPTSAADLVAAGCHSIVIVPVFMGQGGHVRRDLTSLLAALRDRHPGVDFTSATAVGEDDAVLDAVAAYCHRIVLASTLDAEPPVR